MYSNLKQYLDKLAKEETNQDFDFCLKNVTRLHNSSVWNIERRHKLQILRYWLEFERGKIDNLPALYIEGNGWTNVYSSKISKQTDTLADAQPIRFNIELNIVLPINRFTNRWTEHQWLSKYGKLMRSKLGTKESFRRFYYDLQSYESQHLSSKRKSWYADYRYYKNSFSSFATKIRSKSLDPEAYKYERAIGIEIECYGLALGEKLPLWCREKGDGSLNVGGIEFVALVKRSELEHRLYKLCDLIKGYRVDKKCGLHIHLDCRSKSLDEVKTIAKKLNTWLYALREFVASSRRDNDYCKFGISERNRYRAVNICSFEKHKTIEIRLHSGTTDYTKIISWIRLLELLLVVKGTTKGKEGVQALLDLPLCEYERAYWLKRHQVLNPALYANAVPSTEVE